MESNIDGVSICLASQLGEPVRCVTEREFRERDQRGYLLDGTSGALFSIYLPALARVLREQPGQGRCRHWHMEQGGCHCHARNEKVYSRPGSPKGGAESTKGMKPKLGRTVYIDRVGDIPDPGAVGIAVWWRCWRRFRGCWPISVFTGYLSFCLRRSRQRTGEVGRHTVCSDVSIVDGKGYIRHDQK